MAPLLKLNIQAKAPPKNSALIEILGNAKIRASHIKQATLITILRITVARIAEFFKNLDRISFKTSNYIIN